MCIRRTSIVIRLVLGLGAFSWGIDRARAQTVDSTKTNGALATLGTQAPQSAPQPQRLPATPAQGTMRSMTHADRVAAAARKQSGATAEFAASLGPLGPLAPPTAAMNPGGTPDYFNVGNWAFSPIPSVDPNGVITGGIPKFVCRLPGLTAANANEIGQYISVATPITQSIFPNDDYYEIGLFEYDEQMHPNLPPTRIRGYRDLNPSGDTKTCYLGPVIIAKKDRPVRIKFSNQLPAGTAGNLRVPVDTTLMGAGAGPDPNYSYQQNRATVHLHGGRNPWISDGTPHQWTVPVGDTAAYYQKGMSAMDVPDMWFDPTTHALVPPGTPGATNDPGQGSQTYYWTNQQSGRLMFYHDHAYGITRLNVYAGEAAGYLIWDQVEEDLISGTNVSGGNPSGKQVLPGPALPDPHHFGIPLIIQDKTFVDADRIAAQDPTWNWGTTPPTPHTGDLWFPHVYMPNQNPMDAAGANNMGRWDYGPWFWPPLNAAAGLIHAELVDPNTGLHTPATPNPSAVPEAFMDTPIINGCAYPVLPVQRQAYRFRILNACNDRMLNLGLYYADTGGGTGATATATVSYIVSGIAVTNGGTGYDPNTPPAVTVAAPGGPGTTATATSTVTGLVTSIAVTSGGSGYTIPPLVIIQGPGIGATATASVSGGAVTAITVTNQGSDYTATPNVIITGGNGTGATAVATVTYEVTGVTVTNPGSGYDPNTIPAVTIAAPASGTTATAAATLDGQVTAVTVNTGGSGYTSAPNVYFFGGGGTGVAATAALTAGAVTAISITNGGTGYTSAPQVTVGNSTEVKMVPAVPTPGWPAVWPTDGRDGGVPDPCTAGPPIIQIGTEGGLLPAPVVIPSTPVGYEYNRRNIVVLNVSTKGLFFGPAERVDIIIDFSQVPASPNVTNIILYNDAPAPVPGFDPRNDYYAGAPDHSPTGDNTGGAPTPLPGYGPNTRTIMQFQVAAGSPTATPFDLATLKAVMPVAYATQQPPPVVPQTTYPPPFRAATDTYVRIQDTSLSFTPVSNGLGSVALTAGGSGYTSVPAVTITGGGGTGATAAATITNAVNTLTLTNTVTGIRVTNGGSGYAAPPTVTISGGGGSGAAATATVAGGVVTGITLTNAVTRVFVTSGGTGYTAAPTVTLTGGGGTGATATATITNVVSGITITNVGSDYTSIPSVTISPPGGGGITATGVAVLAGGKVADITITNPGTGYTSPPTVTISPPGGTGTPATATATVTGAVSGVTITAAGTGYTTAPTVVFTGTGTGAAATAIIGTGGLGYTSAPTVTLSAPGGAGTTATAVATIGLGGTGFTAAPTIGFVGGGPGTGAAATAALGNGAVSSLTLTNGGTGYTSAPTIAFAGGGGTGAAATATISAGSVTGVTVTNGGSGYTTAPTVSFSGGGGTGAAATAAITFSVTGLALTAGGNGYTSAPLVTFTGGGGTGAAATATITGVVDTLTLTNPGTSYTAEPNVTFTGGGGSGATATASLSRPTPLLSKAIHELFELDYGRMNALLGVELPLTNWTTQTTIPYGYIDPPVEILGYEEPQVWKITHNGVDTHVIHFHLFDVQLINRVGWDGMVTPPDLNELGWKDTVRMNPLEDCIVAFKPVCPNVPFMLPDSVRPLDVTMPVGGMIDSHTGFSNVDPYGNPRTVMNEMTNFGWEYVWHCHILGHEENDMMRPIVYDGPAVPGAPTDVTATAGNGEATVTFVAPFSSGSGPITGYTVTSVPPGGVDTNAGTTSLSHTITGLTNGTTYTLYVRAISALGAGPAGVSNPVMPGGLQTPTNLTARIPPLPPLRVALAWTNNEPTATGFTIQRATDAGFTTGVITFTTTGATPTYVNVYGVAANTTYHYRVRATEGANTSPWSAPVSITAGAAASLAAPTNLTARIPPLPPLRVALAWTNNAPTATGFTIQRANDPAFTTGVLTINTTGPSTSYVNVYGVAANTTYYYRVLATQGASMSPWSATVSITTGPPPSLPAPTNLTGTIPPLAPLRVALAWTNNAPAATGFTIQRANDPGFTTGVNTINTAAPATTYVNIYGLVANATYYYRVLATDGTNLSTWSNTLTISTAAPAAPTGLTATPSVVSPTTAQVVLNWSATGNNIGAFTVQTATNPGFTGATSLTVPRADRTTTIGGLARGTPYYFRIQAYNPSGASAWVSVSTTTP
jgi:FtsP/CotA-like multicopper oxidase with cupredoxin domain